MASRLKAARSRARDLECYMADLVATQRELASEQERLAASVEDIDQRLLRVRERTVLPQDAALEDLRQALARIEAAQKETETQLTLRDGARE